MDISEKEKALLESLTASNKKEDHFKHDFKIDQKIVGLIIHDKHFLVQCLDLIKPEYFEDKGHQLITSIVFKFFREYKQMPNKSYIQSEIKERFSKSEATLQYLGELDAVLAEYVPGLDSKEYLIDKIVDFAKKQSIRIAISKTVDLVKKNSENMIEYARTLWNEALTVDKSYDIGLNYFASLEERYEQMIQYKEHKEVFTSGFAAGMIGHGSLGIDGLLTEGGLCRGEIGAFVGLSGSGKSIALINAAMKNLQWGKKVCYITLEMSEEKIAKRFDALFSNVAFADLISQRDLVIKAIKDTVKHEEDKRRLVIKHFPGGTADTNTFRAYLSQLSLYGFKPDLLVIDYVGEMKDLPGYKTYESRQLLVRDLRTIAQEEQICVLTAIQANRKGREDQELGGQIDDDALADSFGQARPMDLILSINKPESGCNIGTIFAVKVRDGISRREICYKMDTETLLMTEINRELWQTILTEHRKLKANKVKVKEMDIGNE